MSNFRLTSVLVYGADELAPGDYVPIEVFAGRLPAFETEPVKVIELRFSRSGECSWTVGSFTATYDFPLAVPWMVWPFVVQRYGPGPTDEELADQVAEAIGELRELIRG